MDGAIAFERIGVALAIGLLVGVERGWKQRDAPDETRVAGIRTYTLIGLLGGVAGILGVGIGSLAFAAVALVFGLTWAAFKAWEALTDGDISVTGAVAGMLVFVLGALAAAGDMATAAAAGVTVVVTLAFKEAAHNWVKALKFEELRSALAILAATFIALPLLPERALDPYGAFNPRELWLLTIVIASASFAGYVALRALGPKAGLYVGAAAGALVSSTAVTVDLARRAKAGLASPGHAAVAALVANAVMFVRVGVMIMIFAPTALGVAAPALLMAAATSLLGGFYLAQRAVTSADVRGPASIGSPLDFVAVARFALLLAAITVAARVVLHFYDAPGLMAFAAIAGLVDVDAVALAVGGLARSGLDSGLAARAILLAAAVDTVSKIGMAGFAGRSSFLKPYGIISALSLVCGIVSFLLARTAAG